MVRTTTNNLHNNVSEFRELGCH